MFHVKLFIYILYIYYIYNIIIYIYYTQGGSLEPSGSDAPAYPSRITLPRLAPLTEV